ncbi:hypothetical protein [Calidithermus chliarophilus]|uniref:hypothetical protein n=1 Tax=Calidithermus chliarophilus TaxID=52023 RepID=UPI0003FE9F5B|nr:hypothetical protein [Calidithermus chliarophilus]
MFRHGLIVLVLAVLAACKEQGQGSTPPPWALGEQPNFSGAMEYWAKGDAIAPAEGSIFAYSYYSDPEGELVGLGQIKADGSFTFGLVRGAGGYAVPVEQAICAGLSLGNAQQKVAIPEVLEVPALYVEGVHARPGGGVLVSTQHPIAPGAPRYQFVYADRDGTVKGSCGGFAINLDLRQGWNSIVWQASEFKTAAIPKEARWYFINPLTAGE